MSIFSKDTRFGSILVRHGCRYSTPCKKCVHSMVGVPKRVRGCDACKRRRVTCGLERPTCTRCKKDGRDCRYPNAFMFVVNDPGTHKTVYRKPSPDSLTTSTTPACDGSNTPGEGQQPPSNMQLVPISTVPLPMEAFHMPFNIHQTIPSQPSTLTLTQQQLFSYAVAHFPTQPYTDISLIQIWIPALQHFTHSSKSLKASPLACCAVWLARNDCNPAMVDFSRYLYAQGLQEVRTALEVPRAILEDETLGACLALACFEVFECPGQSRAAYEWHRKASVNLLQMRGAKMHREGIGHELFLAVRLHGIFYAFEQKKPNFLCTREWSKVPWQYTPKDDFHRLADILARGPQLLHEAEDLPNKPLEQSLPTLLTILSRLLDIDADLETFYAKLETDHVGPLYWEDPSSVPSSTTTTTSNPHENNLTFPSLPLASLLTLHWSIKTMVWSALEGIHSGLAQTRTLPLLPTSPQTTRFKLLAPTQHWLLPVRNIVRSIDYSMAMTAGSATPPGIGVALEIVIDVMRQKPLVVCEEELRRASGARAEMGRRWAAIFLA